MNFHVDFKASFLIKNLSTLLAGVRSLSSMNSHLRIKVLCFVSFFGEEVLIMGSWKFPHVNKLPLGK